MDLYGFALDTDGVVVWSNQHMLDFASEANLRRIRDSLKQFLRDDAVEWLRLGIPLVRRHRRR
jgi:hypothetical protein